MNNERLQELAHGLALGELGLAEEQEFFALLGSADAAAREGLARLFDATAAACMGMPVELPPPDLKERILQSILKPAPARPESKSANPHFHFLRGDDSEGWQALPVKGAYVKPLSIDPARGAAVVLGKLEPGTHYPPHQHTGPEEVYVISGDLTIGTTRLGAGDFHHAEAGSDHGVNFSDSGCMVLVVLSIADLKAQYEAAEIASRSS